MPLTRTQASALLGATEMGLYDDSRANAVRGHTPAKLAQLVARTRKARDRARDLEKRQKLASRAKTGSKTGRSGQANARTGDKAELLGDILLRFEVQQKAAGKPPAKKAVKKAAATKAPVRKATAKKAAAKKAAVKKAAPTKATAKQAAVTKAQASRATTTAAARASGKKADVARAPAKQVALKKVANPLPASTGAKAAAGDVARRLPAKPARASRQASTAAPVGSQTGSVASSRVKAPRAITPRKALDNTRKLLEQKQAEARAPKPWQALDGHHDAAPATGDASGQAAGKALELHAAESRMAATQGSASTRGRKNQGKRDQRSAPE